VRINSKESVGIDGRSNGWALGEEIVFHGAIPLGVSLIQ
jgi:hypothetical protein